MKHYHPYFYNYAHPEIIQFAVSKGFKTKLTRVVYEWDHLLLHWELKNQNRFKGDNKLTATCQNDLKDWLENHHQIKIEDGNDWGDFNKNIQSALIQICNES